MAQVQDGGAQAGTVCLPCWHFRRQVFKETEYHVLCVCPEYSHARQQFLHSLGPNASLDTHSQMIQMLSSHSSDTLQQVGRYCVRVRQKRRKLKLMLESYSNEFEARSYSCKRVAWKIKRRPSCRHGVLFSHLPVGGCSCMSESYLEADWTHAKFMPALHHRLKTIVAVPFHLPSFSRLAILQAEARRHGW